MEGNLTTMVPMLSAGRLMGAWGRGCQLFAPTLPPPLLMTTIAAVVGGRCAPPPPVCLVLPDAACCCQCCQLRLTGQHEGIRGVVICMVKEEEVCAIVLICLVPIQPGVYDGGKRSGVMLVGYVADNVRLGKDEEEALCHEGKDDNDDGYRGGGG
jgi:hypothetical protein